MSQRPDGAYWIQPTAGAKWVRADWAGGAWSTASDDVLSFGEPFAVKPYDPDTITLLEPGPLPPEIAKGPPSGS